MKHSIPPESLSVVMVTLNEAQAIARVVNEIKEQVPDAEIVVVDSGTDETAEIARSLGCLVVRQFPPRGYGPAMHEALRSASGEIVVTVDCDGTYPAVYIPRMVELIQSGFDIVNCSRLKGRPAAMPLPNYFANLAFAVLARLLCGLDATDVHSGMRAYRKSLLREFAYDPEGMALPVELLVGPSRLGYRITELFIEYRPRLGETTLDPLAGTLWTLRRLWKWRRGSRFAKISP